VADDSAGAPRLVLLVGDMLEHWTNGFLPVRADQCLRSPPAVACPVHHAAAAAAATSSGHRIASHRIASRCIAARWRHSVHSRSLGARALLTASLGSAAAVGRRRRCIGSLHRPACRATRSCSSSRTTTRHSTAPHTRLFWHSARVSFIAMDARQLRPNGLPRVWRPCHAQGRARPGVDDDRIVGANRAVEQIARQAARLPTLIR
jgi:hypothetical protein